MERHHQMIQRDLHSVPLQEPYNDASSLSDAFSKLNIDSSRLNDDFSRLSDNSSRLSDNHSRLSYNRSRFNDDRLRFNDDRSRLSFGHNPTTDLGQSEDRFAHDLSSGRQAYGVNQAHPVTGFDYIQKIMSIERKVLLSKKMEVENQLRLLQSQTVNEATLHKKSQLENSLRELNEQIDISAQF